MRLILLRLCYLTAFLFVTAIAANAQSFSFNCTRDTLIPGCSNVCFTLKGKIPDIKGLTSSYTINPTSTQAGCFPVYVQPNDPAGTPSSLTIDDRYSSVISMGFPFPFYGTVYNSLIASTNGYLSFDVSKAAAFAHWTINNDLPSATYDRAMIMGPYHDLNPNVSQPTQRIQYQMFGTAPHRRWILSFYRVPLFGTSCTGLFENTHQIILYESTGIIEVAIFSKQTCTGWNNGRAIVGIQNWDRNQGMMAPGRTGLGPTWGSVNMNESWRFVPNSGPSLFKRVELYDLSGNLIMPGTAVSMGNGTMEASFPNFCPSGAGTTSYIIKSVYQKIDDPSAEIFGTDTIRITRDAPPLQASAASTATSCNGASNGSITVTPTSGAAPFSYSLNGAPPVPGGSPFTFTNVSSGTHTVVVFDASGCVSTQMQVTVDAGPDLTASASSAPTSCNGAINGTITVTPSSGTAPFLYSLDGGAPVPGGNTYTFNNISSGSHSVVVTDAAGCITGTIPVTVVAGPPITTTVSKTDALCFGTPTGTITVSPPSPGSAPFEYSLDGITWQSGNIFSGLAAGNYTAYFRESNGCQGSQIVTVGQPSVLDGNTATVPVVCNGQPNGIITVTPSGAVPPYQYSIDNGTNWQSSNVFNVPAGNYTVSIRDANNCLITRNVTVTEPSVLTASSVNTNASCDGGNDGTIQVSASGGNSSYTYAVDSTNFQVSNLFNVAPGNYLVTVRDNLGCKTSFSTTVGLTSNLVLTPMADAVICESKSVQLQLASNATQYAWTPATGLNNSAVFNPVASPVVSTQYIVTATLGRCSLNDTVVVNVNPAPKPNAGPDGFICSGQTFQLQGSGGTQYSWSPTTYLDNPLIPNPVSSAPKDITYSLSILSDANGCASLVTDEMTLDVTAPIKVKTLPFDTVAYAGDQIKLLALTNDPDVINYNWTPSRGLSNANVADPVVTVGAIGEVVQYRVVTSTVAGCKGEGFVTVRVYKGPDIYVATGFTPNNDGKNDRFIPFPVGIKTLNYFRVFNRWGQMVFSTSRLHDGWDGKIQGVDQPTGTYVWMIEAITNENKVISKKGTVTLIR